MSWLGHEIGPYQILRAIGAGGMGEVYEAAHTRLAGKRYAIKILLPDLVSPGLLARFQREAEILARLRHPGIVAVHDYNTASGAVYLAMDLLDGENLATRLARGLPDVAEALRVIEQVAAALDAAHAAGVVHRDLKPANIFLCEPDGRAVVLDFGVAKDRRAAGDLTAAGDYFGTPAYMSPEQASGKNDLVDNRTDVFALGAIAWELLVGAPAFSGDTLTAIFAAIASGPRPQLRRFRPDLPVAAGAVIERALAIDPSSRFASVRELSAELSAALGGVASVPPPVVASVAPTPGTDPTPRPSRPIAPADDNVQFSVYRPAIAAPETWHPLLAFAHLSDRPIDAGPDEPDPIAEVKRQAAAVLGDRAGDYREVTTDSRQAVPREGELTFVPEVPGVSFNPPSRSFLWLESVHREEFRFKAPGRLAGVTARGRVTVYLGRIILAEISLAIRVGDAAAPVDAAATEPTHARPFRKIFPSFAPEDRAVVDELERHARSLGDMFLGGALRLRDGGGGAELQRLIAEADVFQLFWSSRSMRSPAIRAEWEHALSLGRPGFVRPTYWEEPLPADPAIGLPPPSLVQLGFEKLGWAAPRRESPVELVATLPAPPLSAPRPGQAPRPRAPQPAPVKTTMAMGAPPEQPGGDPPGGFAGAAPPPPGSGPPVSGAMPVNSFGAPDEPLRRAPEPSSRPGSWWIAAIALAILAAVAAALYLLAG